jgi:hypothetical protein
MNRRPLAIIAVIIAVGLFIAPLISPVPDHAPRLEVDAASEPSDFSSVEEREKEIGNTTTLRYQNLSPAAQRLFEKGSTQPDGVTVRYKKAPEVFTTLIPRSGSGEIVYVQKDGQYYYMVLGQNTRQPSLLAFMLRAGSFLGAVGLATLAGYFVLTAKD